MKEFVLASNNNHKLKEIRDIMQGIAIIKSLAEVGLEGDIPETAETLEGNAYLKAQWVWERLASKGTTLAGCFADDTGLEVEALGGRPGVYSARYAGEHCSFDDNINKLLGELEGKDNRRAAFRTVICLIDFAKKDKAEPLYFEGRVDGKILTERYGTDGFGYDPVFMPDRFAVSFAEMPLEVKNSISHRGLAVAKLKEYLCS